MGSYGIGIDRALACVVEAHHDEKGICWPADLAPYHAHVVTLGAAREPAVTEAAERLEQAAEAADREILYDDRDESPGVKLTDAELLGMPTILTISPRSLKAGGVEITDRATGERRVETIDAVEALLRDGVPVSR
jgi:prolyl-tRNA synthetase